jgi:magnesium-transporting ATPase (P-type)
MAVSTPYQVNIRMMTGDHIETARRVAVDSGLITEEESSQPEIVMTAE